MAYEKQTWNTGDVITADKLNHMEDGIELGGSELFIIHVNHDDNVISDKTYREIFDAKRSGKVCILVDNSGCVYTCANNDYSGILFTSVQLHAYIDGEMDESISMHSYTFLDDGEISFNKYNIVTRAS